MAADRLSSTFGWLEMLRLPILLTAPGGALAGYAFVSDGFSDVQRPSSVVVAMLAPLLIMAGGFLLNDWRDRRQDELDRPAAPLASGLVHATSVLLVGSLLVLGGALISFAATGLAGSIGLGLAVLTVLHAMSLRRLPVIGLLSVGLIYALPLLLGAAAADGLSDSAMIFVWLAAAISFLYVAAVMRLWGQTRREQPAGRGAMVVIATIPLLLLLTGLEGILGGGWTCLGLWVIWALLIYTTTYLVRQLWKQPTAERGYARLGYLLRSLILLQSYWVAASGASCFMVAVVLLLWPLAGYLSRRL